MSSHHPFILSLHPGRGNLITSPLSSSSPMEPLLNPSPRFWSRPSSSRHRRRRSARAAKMGVRLSPTRPDDVPRGPPLLTAPADPRRSTKLPPPPPPPSSSLSGDHRRNPPPKNPFFLDCWRNPPNRTIKGLTFFRQIAPAKLPESDKAC